MSSEDRDSLFKLAQLRSAYKRDLSLDCIEKILQTKGDINFSIPDGEECAGWTALHFAQRRDVIELLIDYGADFTIKDHEEETALHKGRSVEYCEDWGLLKKLSNEITDAILSAHVKKAVVANPGNRNGLTHFHVACMADHAAAVQMFLDNGVPADLAVGENSSTFPGCTALQIATRSCAPEVVKVLLKYGADPCAKDGDGMTVMHWLINSSIKIVDSLIIEEVEIGRLTWTSKLESNQEMMYLLIDSFMSTDEKIELSQLHIACSIGDASVAEHFLSQEAQMDHRVNADSSLWPGYTALHFAAHFDVNTVHLLVERGANVMAKSAEGITPFDICLERYNAKEICLLMSKQPTWKTITLLDGKTKLLDLVSAMEDIEEYQCFFDENIDDVNTSVVENSPLWPGFTPLHIAVIFSEQRKNASNYLSIETFDAELDFIEECLDRGADITVKDASGCTPLHLAFRHQRTRTIAKLLEDDDSSVNPIDEDKVSQLHIACASGNEEAVDNLIQSGADVNLQVVSDFKFYRIPIPSSHIRKPSHTESHWIKVQRIHAGSTPLHIAVAGGNSEVVQLLVDNGADVNLIDDNGATPIHCLLVQQSEGTGKEIADILLSADLKAVTLSGPGITHLHVASFFDHVDAADILLDLGADVDARLGCQSELEDFYERYNNGEVRPDSYGCFAEVTALHNAVWRRSAEIARFLISRGADLLTKSPCGESPLNSMINDKYGKKCMKMLAEVLRGNEALARRVREDYGLTLIHLASGEADPEAVKTLIDAGANVNAQMTEEALGWAGYTPLHATVEYPSSALDILCVNDRVPEGVLQTIRVLLDAGADVSLCDASGNTPLHLIANNLSYEEEFHGEWLNVMLNSIKDFRVNPTGEGGMSHFHIACLQNNEMAIEKFLQHGVDVNAAIDFFNDQRAGDSALHLLAQKEFQPPLKVETIDALLAHGAKVDAQNADGDTVLHVIARFAPKRVDIFRSLFRAGTDHTKLNTLCETPLALLLLSKEATPEVIELFVEHSCCVNEFNAVDQQGFLAGPLCVSDSVLNDRTRIFDTLFESRGIAKLDAIGRTAIQNIVSVAGFRISESVTVEEYSTLVARLSNMGCDIDSQDQSGRTALHLAAQFKNNKAIAALLINGADFNVVDSFDKTAFSYGADICKCTSIEARHRHSDIVSTFIKHLKKMHHFKLNVNNRNRNVMLKMNVLPDVEMKRFYREVKQIRLFKFEENSISINLIDMLSETGMVAVYPHKAAVRFLVDKFFRDINVYLQDYTEITGLLQFQMRKAVKRIELIEPAADSLNRAVDLLFPETCSRIVLRHLSNYDLKSLIHAMND